MFLALNLVEISVKKKNCYFDSQIQILFCIFRFFLTFIQFFFLSDQSGRSVLYYTQVYSTGQMTPEYALTTGRPGSLSQFYLPTLIKARTGPSYNYCNDFFARVLSSIVPVKKERSARAPLPVTCSAPNLWSGRRTPGPSGSLFPCDLHFRI